MRVLGQRRSRVGHGFPSSRMRLSAANPPAVPVTTGRTARLLESRVGGHERGSRGAAPRGSSAAQDVPEWDLSIGLRQPDSDAVTVVVSWSDQAGCAVCLFRNLSSAASCLKPALRVRKSPPRAPSRTIPRATSRAQYQEHERDGESRPCQRASIPSDAQEERDPRCPEARRPPPPWARASWSASPGRLQVVVLVYRSSVT